VRDEGVPAVKISLCYNGIDTTTFHPGPAVRMDVVKDAELVVGAICVLRPEKRLDVLVDAFARIAAPGRTLVIVGSGAMLPELRQQCARLSIEPYCHFEPNTSAVAAWLHSMDVFVLPSRTEALSNSLMEAMACGCAVVASDVGGNPELVSHFSTGLLFPSGDAQALADALKMLAQDPKLRAELGDRAAASIEQRFTVAISAHRMGEIYREKLQEFTSQPG